MSNQPYKTAQAHRGSLSSFLKQYKYQPDLTAQLDELPNEPFSQDTVNEIVLWKTNRYVRLPEELRRSLELLRTLSPKDHRQAEPVLAKLLDCHGVDLPMASTFLRFKNPDVFQIVDRHAYRAVFGKRFPVYSASPSHKKVSVYFSYLDSLHSLVVSHRLRFRDLDRILYVFDKVKNGTL